MDFIKHSELEGLHAFLGASKPHWLNYTKDKLRSVYRARQAAKRGEDLHKWAHDSITLRRKAPETLDAINMYVNDGIGFRMICEQPLFYSMNSFGTADTISFDLKNNMLRIHDLKTGRIEVKNFWQLIVYAALFCLEYQFSAHEIKVELRIYQGKDVKIYIPTVEELARAIDTIITSDEIIKEIQKEERQ